MCLERRILTSLRERPNSFMATAALNQTTGSTTGVAQAQSQLTCVTAADIGLLLKRYLNVISSRQSGSLLASICELPTHRELLTQMTGEKCVKAALEFFGARVSRDIELPSEHFEEQVFAMLEESRYFLI